jgi:2-keto-4-pentenoate hydratase/2-oxohepta-3-ene-1,7-dioic acid hydratase in catechol pathway
MRIPLVRGTSTEHIDLVPSKIVGIGLNYRAHAAEMGKGLPEEPLIFLKPSSAMIPTGEPIERPGGYERVDYEAELGLTICNDVSVRDLQKKDVQYTRAKGFDTFCPIGPRIIGGLDPSRLAIKTRVNGTIRQDSSTADMIFDVPALIAFVSMHMTLQPGDVISTGTPSGVGNLTPGDVVAIEIEGIGVLENPVIARP